MNIVTFIQLSTMYFIQHLSSGISGERENLVLVTPQGLEAEVPNIHILLHMNNCHCAFSSWSMNHNLDRAL